MNNESRTRNTLRNLTFGFGAQVLQYTLSFITRTIFIALLSVEYLGVNGLFTNVLSVLSLAELGVGGAFVSLLYKPLHENDVEKIKSLMFAYRRAYMLIAVVVGIAGLSIYPFLNIFIKDNNIENIGIIYLMFLTGSVTSYLFAYKIDLLIADQKIYIRTIYTQIFVFIQYIFQIAALLLTRNFILYLAIQITCPILNNLIISSKINRLYPFLKEKSLLLDRDTYKDLKNRVSAGMYHHFGYVIINGTDSIVISAFLGVYCVGLYSNYLLIIGVVSAFIKLAFVSVTASIGNLTVSSEKEKSYDVFCKLQFLNFILSGFSAICFITLFNPFIGLWIGDEYVLSQYIVVLIVVMFYLGQSGMQYSINIFKETTGLFYYDRYYSLLEGLINIIASIFLVRIWGLAGVFVGTIIAILATRFWTEAYFVFGKLFCQPLSKYYYRYFKYALNTLVVAAVVYYTARLIPHDSWTGFFIMAASTALLILMAFSICFCRSDEFAFFLKIATNVLNRTKNSEKTGKA